MFLCMFVLPCNIILYHVIIIVEKQDRLGIFHTMSSESLMNMHVSFDVPHGAMWLSLCIKIFFKDNVKCSKNTTHRIISNVNYQCLLSPHTHTHTHTHTITFTVLGHNKPKGKQKVCVVCTNCHGYILTNIQIVGLIRLCSVK